jgi:hypothetical protein
MASAPITGSTLFAALLKKSLLDRSSSYFFSFSFMPAVLFMVPTYLHPGH